ncbi:MAG TPA: SurA N-terminal domain-containing protein, partial [Gaiellaceae bacterium]|nr:SurA N-terminal domain-containing protein [Gaiellaceae bacterium]
MTLARITLGILLATLALAASACGGGSESVPSGAIAVVDGTEISEDDLDELIAQAKKGYESQKQEFPKAGTPEFQSIQTQYVAYLVELEEFRQAAEELGVSVTDEDVDKAEQELIKDRFDGKRAEYEKALEA